MIKQVFLVILVLTCGTTGFPQTAEIVEPIWEDSVGNPVGPYLGVSTSLSVNDVSGLASISSDGSYFYENTVYFATLDCSGMPMRQASTGPLGQVVVLYQISADDDRLFAAGEDIGAAVTSTASSFSQEGVGCQTIEEPATGMYYVATVIEPDITNIFTPPYSIVFRRPPCLFVDCFGTGTTDAWSGAVPGS